MWKSHFGDEVTAISLATAEFWRQAARSGRGRGVAAITACSSGLTIRTPANKWRSQEDSSLIPAGTCPTPSVAATAQNSLTPTSTRPSTFGSAGAALGIPGSADGGRPGGRTALPSPSTRPMGRSPTSAQTTLPGMPTAGW